MQLPTDRHVLIAGLLFILTFLHSTGLYLYLKGFLLTRQTLDLPALPIDKVSTTPFDRVLLIVIDALRFDFAIHTEQQQHFRNQIPVFERLLSERPSSSLLFQFRADPPTTTMQRVKGLMTGSLPTFIDAGSNFATSAVNEDHLLRQIRKRFNDIYFMGDDTWVNLYPEIFSERNKTFESDSFKMFDLDTVDNRILQHLWPILEHEPWEVAIAHFLGVDHCGHTYGPSHPNMATKLKQMNSVIERLVNEHVDENTLLVVMGDHGMSVEGDHGGESIEELTSALFLYSGRPLTDTSMRDFYRAIHQSRANELGYNMREIQERLSYDPSVFPTVAQVQLVPTLAYLLGVPIPFGNLGALIPDVIMPERNSDGTLQHMAQEFRHNAHQVRNYLQKYSEHTGHPGFSATALEPLYQHLLDAKEKHATESFEDAIFEYDRFLTSTIKYCRAIWAQFDVGSMAVGISILVLTTCATVYLSFVHEPRLAVYRAAVGAVASSLLAGLAVLVVTLKDEIRGHGWFEKMSDIDGAVALGTMACAAAILAGTKEQRPASVPSTWITILLGTVVHAFTLASNSFVIWEDRGTRFISATLSIWWAASSRQLRAPLILLAWIRLTGLAGQCREEQFPHCQYVHSASFTADHPFSMLGFVTFNSVLVLYFLPRLFMRRSVGHTWRLWVYEAVLIVVFVRQVQELYEGSANSEPLISWQLELLNVYLPRLVYLLCTLTTIRARSCWWSFISVWSATLAMLQRPLASTIMLTVPAVMDLLAASSATAMVDGPIRLALMHMIGQHLFFVTGHQATFTSLPWKAAFIGFDYMNYYGGATLVALSTLSGPLMTWISWPLVASTIGGDTQQSSLSLYMLMILQLIPTCFSAFFVFILRRHLMTWKIFAPRFLLQGLLGVGSHIAAILSAWLCPIEIA